MTDKTAKTILYSVAALMVGAQFFYGFLLISRGSLLPVFLSPVFGTMMAYKFYRMS